MFQKKIFQSPYDAFIRISRSSMHLKHSKIVVLKHSKMCWTWLLIFVHNIYILALSNGWTALDSRCIFTCSLISMFCSMIIDHFKLFLYKDREDYLRKSKIIDGHNPAPFEDVFGCHRGHCIDNEHPHCIVMIGRRSVFLISYPNIHQMVAWADRLESVLKCKYSLYHFKKSCEISISSTCGDI